MIRTIGLTRTPISKRSSLNSGANTPKNRTTVDDIALLDQLLTSLLGMKEKRRSFKSHRGTPRSSHLPVINERRQRTESWPDRIYEDSVVRSVINNLRASKRSSQVDEPFLTPKWKQNIKIDWNNNVWDVRDVWSSKILVRMFKIDDRWSTNNIQIIQQ